MGILKESDCPARLPGFPCKAARIGEIDSRFPIPNSQFPMPVKKAGLGIENAKSEICDPNNAG